MPLHTVCGMGTILFVACATATNRAFLHPTSAPSAFYFKPPPVRTCQRSSASSKPLHVRVHTLASPAFRGLPSRPVFRFAPDLLRIHYNRGWASLTLCCSKFKIKKTGSLAGQCLVATERQWVGGDILTSGILNIGSKVQIFNFFCNYSQISLFWNLILNL